MIQERGIEIRHSYTFNYLYNKQCELIEKLIHKFFVNPDHYIKNKIKQDITKVTFAPRLNFTINDFDTVVDIMKNSSSE